MFYRYLLPTNALIRKHLCEKAGAMDKWTSLGTDGYRALIKAYFKTFKMDELDLPQDLMNRGVENSDQLPGYLYRDDGLKLWNAIGKFCFRVITHFYTTDDDVKEDTEIQAWITVRMHSYQLASNLFYCFIFNMHHAIKIGKMCFKLAVVRFNYKNCITKVSRNS